MAIIETVELTDDVAGKDGAIAGGISITHIASSMGMHFQAENGAGLRLPGTDNGSFIHLA